MTTRARFAGRSLAEGCGPRSRRPTIEDEVFTNSAVEFHNGGRANRNYGRGVGAIARTPQGRGK